MISLFGARYTLARVMCQHCRPRYIADANPAWYHNIAAHPDQVWAEFGGRQMRVTATQLDGDAREQAWPRITQLQPRYARYQRKTDRAIPVIRPSPAD